MQYSTNPGPSLELVEFEVGLGPRRLILDRSCVLQSGRLYLVLGRSGSGKSSFARALLGFGELSDPPTEGRGKAIVRDASGHAHTLWDGLSYDPAVRPRIAFLPQAERLGFLDGLSVTDNLSLFSRVSPPAAATEIKRLADQFRLCPLPTALASASGGERIRLSAIRGLLPRDAQGGMPEVVIADEPTGGLDRESAASMAQSLKELAARGESVVIVITHEPELFVEGIAANQWTREPAVQILECPLGAAGGAVKAVNKLRLEPRPKLPHAAPPWLDRARAAFGNLGAVTLSPIAFVWGLCGLHRPLVLLRQILIDSFGLSTQAFSLVGCLLVAGTVAYFIFERMPRPELVQPLLLPELMIVTGHSLVRMVLPLGACCLVTAKLGAAQAARTAAAVRGGLLETLALANWRIEAYALVPAVMAQFLAMLLATALAIICGVILAAFVYVAGHEGASVPLTMNLMVDGLEKAPYWSRYALAKIALSSFFGGTIAALYGTVPSRAEDDVARAVHRTLFWGVLAVIACQCALVLWEFAP